MTEQDIKSEIFLLRRNLARKEIELAVAKLKVIKYETSLCFRLAKFFNLFSFFVSKFNFCLSRAYAVYKIGGIKSLIQKVRSIYNKQVLVKNVTSQDSINHYHAMLALRDVENQPTDKLSENAPQIVMLVDSFNDGGLERVVIDLTTELKKCGFNVWILVVGNGARAMQEAIGLGLRVEECSGSSALLNEILVHNKPDLAMMHHCYSNLSVLANQHIPIIEVLHNAYFWDVDNHSVQAIRKQIISHFVAVSESVNLYTDQYLGIPKDKITTIANGLNPKGLIRPPLQIRRKLRSDYQEEFRIVLPASFGPQKRHILMVAAYAKLLEKYSNIKLIFVGSPEININVFNRVVEAAKKLNCYDKIDFRGVLNRQEMSQLMSTAHMAVLPSSVEGFSIASLEFAYFGLPCVLSDCGAAKEFISEYKHGLVIKHAAIPFDKLSTMSIANASFDAPDDAVLALVEAISEIKLNYAYWLQQSEEASARWEDYSIRHAAGEYVKLLENKFGLVPN